MRYVWLLALCAAIGWQLWSQMRADSVDAGADDRTRAGERSGAGKPAGRLPGTVGGPGESGDRARERAHEDLHRADRLRDEVRIGTWNLRRLGHGDKRMDWVAQVIDKNFDIVALQEVMTKNAAKELAARLPGWAAVVSSKSVGTKKYREWYAVLYRRAHVKVTRSFMVRDRGDKLVREPFVACMVVHSFDFCMVNVHIIFGDRASQRDAELHALGNKMINLRKKSDERDWLLVGDFNRMPKAPGWDKLRKAGWDFTLPGRVPTSLGKRGYASPYDHILIDKSQTSALRGPTRRVDIVTEPCAGDLAVCRSELSDHAPIVARFATDRDGD